MFFVLFASIHLCLIVITATIFPMEIDWNSETIRGQCSLPRSNKKIILFRWQSILKFVAFQMEFQWISCTVFVSNSKLEWTITSATECIASPLSRFNSIVTNEYYISIASHFTVNSNLWNWFYCQHFFNVWSLLCSYEHFLILTRSRWHKKLFMKNNSTQTLKFKLKLTTLNVIADQMQRNIFSSETEKFETCEFLWQPNQQ